MVLPQFASEGGPTIKTTVFPSRMRVLDTNMDRCFDCCMNIYWRGIGCLRMIQYDKMKMHICAFVCDCSFFRNCMFIVYHHASHKKDRSQTMWIWQVSLQDMLIWPQTLTRVTGTGPQIRSWQDADLGEFVTLYAQRLRLMGIPGARPGMLELQVRIPPKQLVHWAVSKISVVVSMVWLFLAQMCWSGSYPSWKKPSPCHFISTFTVHSLDFGIFWARLQIQSTSSKNHPNIAQYC